MRFAIARFTKLRALSYELLPCLSLLGLLSLATCSATPLDPRLALLPSGEAGMSIEFLNPTPLILPMGVTGRLEVCLPSSGA